MQPQRNARRLPCEPLPLQRCAAMQAASCALDASRRADGCRGACCAFGCVLATRDMRGRVGSGASCCVLSRGGALTSPAASGVVEQRQQECRCVCTSAACAPRRCRDGSARRRGSEARRQSSAVWRIGGPSERHTATAVSTRDCAQPPAASSTSLAVLRGSPLLCSPHHHSCRP
jgi:hypothetical protein